VFLSCSKKTVFTDKKSCSVEAMRTVNADNVKRIILDKFFGNADKSTDYFLRRALAMSLALEFKKSSTVFLYNFLKFNAENRS